MTQEVQLKYNKQKKRDKCRKTETREKER
jgi:hypothetical protein